LTIRGIEKGRVFKIVGIEVFAGVFFLEAAEGDSEGDKEGCQKRIFGGEAAFNNPDKDNEGKERHRGPIANRGNKRDGAMRCNTDRNLLKT
jgi:hypothetical protein